MKIEEIKENIKQAMKNHENIKRDTYRLVLQEVNNVEKNEQKTCNEEDINTIVRKLHKQLSETLDYSKKTNDFDRTDRLQTQVNILDVMLPEELDGDKLRAEIDNICVENSFIHKSDMGKIMKELGSRTKGCFNKRAAAEYLQTCLA